jgi:DNA-binding beta-propeller fold protein YncE
LKKLDSNGAIIQTVGIGRLPALLGFDGTNIWVPNITDASISVVRASTGAVVATLTGNGLSVPESITFDGERVLVADFGTSSVSLWKATDLTPLGNGSTGINTTPFGACSDGLNFWVTLSGTNQLMRF